MPSFSAKLCIREDCKAVPSINSVVHSDDSMYRINRGTQVVLGIAIDYEKLCN